MADIESSFPFFARRSRIGNAVFVQISDGRVVTGQTENSSEQAGHIGEEQVLPHPQGQATPPPPTSGE